MHSKIQTNYIDLHTWTSRDNCQWARLRDLGHFSWWKRKLRQRISLMCSEVWWKCTKKVESGSSKWSSAGADAKDCNSIWMQQYFPIVSMVKQWKTQGDYGVSTCRVGQNLTGCYARQPALANCESDGTWSLEVSTSAVLQFCNFLPSGFKIFIHTKNLTCLW